MLCTLILSVKTQQPLFYQFLILCICNISHSQLFFVSIRIFWFTLDNLALNKQAYQEYRYTGLSLDFTDASNAVDGLKSDLSVWGKQCVVSANNKRTATWWVNLANISSIHHITIFFRTGNYVWGMLDRKRFDAIYM